MTICFQLGNVVMTPGAGEEVGLIQMIESLACHAAGDWGNICAEDQATNEQAVKNGDRILSAYAIDPALPCKGYGDNCLWIITEADRSMTTILFPTSIDRQRAGALNPRHFPTPPSKRDFARATPVLSKAMANSSPTQKQTY